MAEESGIRLPSESMMVRLIEEQLWCGYDEVEKLVGLPLDDENITYLRERVFPTLIPALYELARREQQLALNPGSSRGSYGPTGNTHPISWLAQYLLRNNTQDSAAIREHPYVMVNNELLRKHKH
ncbi:hypothetical protein ERJ75_001675300 [Trypanosoma vivax]|uniref:Uncharacterized protein n=1 Tax=Trypanosoma vivax (strain Y486) TaxID=1055687 RepID=G0U950_TRYVY|nr:hypothetical protein TRVL_05496 [Trypanosoma vivax]KAH8603435.1 hypothetical protein ERJ75_001830900 [Trypanosoma vivax]KAH8604868.1 hypothetical protein ERJ75_001675300 [Trypanosoma vivax]CCC54134.1 hypothetical protein TVY486_1116180 [Trypanosoma vivax Y486]